MASQPSFGLGLAVSKTADGGFAIIELAPGGPAETSQKVHRGDVIISADGTDITQLDNIARYIRGPAGSEVELGIRRSSGSVDFIKLRRAGTTQGPAPARSPTKAPQRAPAPQPRPVPAGSVPVFGAEDLLRRMQALEAIVQSSTQTLLARVERMDQDLSARLTRIEDQVGGIRRGGSGVAPGTTIQDAVQSIFRNMHTRMALTESEFKTVFDQYDANGDGYISQGELRPLLRDLLSANGLAYTLTEEEEALVLQSVDITGNGKLELEELVAAWHEWSCPNHEPRRALVIVDMQNDFLTGSLTVKGGVECIPRINNLRRRFKFDVVVHTQDFHPEGHVSFASTHPGTELFSVKHLDERRGDQVMWPDHCVQGTEGAEFHKDLVMEDEDVVIQKGDKVDVDSYSGFFDNAKGAETKLRRVLRRERIKEVYVVGVAFDFCVGSTALDATTCGFSTALVKDCSASVGPKTEAEMTERLVAAGVSLINAAEVPLESAGPGKDRTRARHGDAAPLAGLFKGLGKNFS